MKNIIKAFSLLSIMAVIPGAMAATSRIGMVTKASPRLPSIAAYLVANSANRTTNGTVTPSTSYMADIDCVNNYSECMRGADACGSEFEECTTNVLLHAKMPVCLGILSQCSASGINSLFGTNSLSAITTPIKNNEGDITGYTYPAPGSALEQMVTGAKIMNTFTKEECVRKYTNCLTRDTVCGSDFELCTDAKTEFKKQAIACDSTLQRCQSDGKIELFGSVTAANTLVPAGESRLDGMIKNGAQLAAINAVKTCQRVTDNCLVSACLANPWRCVEGTSMKKISAADFVIGGETGENTTTSKITSTTSDYDLYALTGSEIRKNLKAQCLETIGANKYCHMTYRERSPKNKDLMDIDLQEDVFSLAYAARKDAVNTKIQEALKKFDTKAKDACIETITSCAMRSCGGGIGSVCFTNAKTADGVAINAGDTYKEIKSGCAAIVNTDPNCQYAATSSEDEGYAYGYNQDVFDKLFTASDATTGADPIGVVAYLNSLLATSYNEGAIANLEKQCRNTALSCVRSMCGTDYVNCYRARTDIISGTYETGTAFDKSMNKMGGVLDYNIVIGLCMNTITSSNTCDEHLKIIAKGVASDLNNSWTGWSSNGDTTYTNVRDAWNGANAISGAKVTPDFIVTDCSSNTTSDCASRGTDACGTVDEDGCVYDVENKVSISDYTLSESAKSLFQKVLVDVEKEVQAKYNAKLTKEKNMCLANNNGGIMGASDNGSTFMWVKLNSNKVPKTYNMKGLTTRQFKASNDLYGSFCRARITVTSDDTAIQQVLGDSATAYFAVGDAFTCGSWIDDKVLAKISEKVGERELCNQGYGTWNTKTGKCEGLSEKEKMAYAWGAVAPYLGAGVAGFFGMDALQKNGSSLGGLLGNKIDDKASKRKNENIEKCIEFAGKAISAKGTASAVRYANSARTYAIYAGLGEKDIGSVLADTATKEEAETEAAKTYTVCNDETSNSLDDSKEEDRLTRFGKNAVAGTALGAVASALGVGITASVIKAKREEIKNEAVKEWMEQVGDHIQCYLGGDELGSYGDTITIEIE